MISFLLLFVHFGPTLLFYKLFFDPQGTRTWVWVVLFVWGLIGTLSGSLMRLVIGFPWWFRWWKFVCNAGIPGSIPRLGRSPGEGMATHSSILAWRIPWTEEPGRLQSMGLQRVRHDWETNPNEEKAKPRYNKVLSHFIRVRLFTILWTVDCQAPLSMRLYRQKSWSELPCSPSGESAWPRNRTQVSYVSCIGRQVL